MRERRCDHVAVDGHPDLLQLRALSVRGLGPRCRACPRQDGCLAARAGRFDWARSSANDAAGIRRRSRERTGCGRGIRRVRDECGYLLDPHTACGVVAAERALGAAGATPQIVLATAHPAKFPDAMQPSPASARRCRQRLLACMTAHERFAVLPNDLGAVGALRRERHARDQRGHGMTPNISTLAERSARRHAPHAAPGDGVARACGWAPAHATSSDGEHGISHLLEHMAFKGTERRSASEIAEEIEAGRRRTQRRDEPRDHRLLRPRPEGRRAASRSTSSPISCRMPHSRVTSSSASAR